MENTNKTNKQKAKQYLKNVLKTYFIFIFDKKEVKFRGIFLLVVCIFLIIVSAIASFLALKLNTSAYYENSGQYAYLSKYKNPPASFMLITDNSFVLVGSLRYFEPAIVWSISVSGLFLFILLAFILPRSYFYGCCFIVAGVLANIFERLAFNYATGSPMVADFYNGKRLWDTWNWSYSQHKLILSSYIQAYSIINYFTFNGTAFSFGDFSNYLGCVLLLVGFVARIVGYIVVAVQKWILPVYKTSQEKSWFLNKQDKRCSFDLLNHNRRITH